MAFGVFLFAHTYHVTIEFFDTRVLQSPIVIRKPYRDRYISPLPQGIKVTPLTTPRVTPTPTQKPKKQAVVSNDRGYKYERQIAYMDQGQKEVMAQVESSLGKAYAELIFRESGFHPESVNSIGACGLFQAYKCEKMNCELTDIDCQLSWGKNYVTKRYGNIENALAFHDSHGWF